MSRSQVVVARNEELQVAEKLCLSRHKRACFWVLDKTLVTQPAAHHCDTPKNECKSKNQAKKDSLLRENFLHNHPIPAVMKLFKNQHYATGHDCYCHAIHMLYSVADFNYLRCAQNIFYCSWCFLDLNFAWHECMKMIKLSFNLRMWMVKTRKVFIGVNKTVQWGLAVWPVMEIAHICRCTKKSQIEDEKVKWASLFVLSF